MVVSILLAGGDGKRLEQNEPKFLIKYKGKQIYKYALDKLVNNVNVDKVIICIPHRLLNTIRSENEKVLFVSGGATRFESLENALKSFNFADEDIAITHDCARVFLSDDMIDNNIKICQKHDFCTTAKHCSDTVYYESKKLDREKLILLETPQSFKYKLWKNATSINKDGTDLISYLNLELSSKNIYYSEVENKKITFLKDLI